MTINHIVILCQVDQSVGFFEVTKSRRNPLVRVSTNRIRLPTEGTRSSMLVAKPEQLPLWTPLHPYPNGSANKLPLQRCWSRCRRRHRRVCLPFFGYR